MTKVFWKDDEEQAVALTAGKLLESGDEKFMNRALLRAQEITLSPERQRPIQSLQSSATYFKSLIPLVMAAEKARNAEIQEERRQEERRHDERRAEQQARIDQEEREEREAEERAQRRAQEQRTDVIIANGLDPLNITSEQMIQPDFIGNLVRSYGSMFEDALVAELTIAAQRAHLRVATTLQSQVKAFEDLPKARPNRPRVLVIGFKSHLNHELYKEFNEFLDLSFLDTSANPKQIQSSASMCDYVLVIRKFVGHHHTDAAKNHPGYHLVNGSISSAKEILSSIAVKFDDQSKAKQ
jgi:hypothetical protein